MPPGDIALPIDFYFCHLDCLGRYPVKPQTHIPGQGRGKANVDGILDIFAHSEHYIIVVKSGPGANLQAAECSYIQAIRVKAALRGDQTHPTNIENTS